MGKAIRVDLKAAIWARNFERLRRVSVRGRPGTDKTILSRTGSQKNSGSKFKQGWREVGGKRNYYRSQWEANFSRYLQWQKERGMIKEWEHEPATFWFEGIKRGCVTYLPDFKVTNNDGTHEWMEVKGHMDAKSRTKINRFRKFFPEEKLRLIDAKWYKENRQKLSLVTPGWE